VERQAAGGKSDALYATFHDVPATTNGFVLPGNTALDQVEASLTE